jgi:hypothetical protein
VTPLDVVAALPDLIATAITAAAVIAVSAAISTHRAAKTAVASEQASADLAARAAAFRAQAEAIRTTDTGDQK